MKIQIAKWGNSLAVRLPVECIRAAGLREGDTVDAQVESSGSIILAPERVFDKTEFLNRLTALHKSLPDTDSVVENMRQVDRY